MKIILFLSLALLISPVWAGIALNGTRVIFDGNDKEASIIVSNLGEEILVQSWLESAEGQPDELPFAVTPPLARLLLKQQQLLRVLYEGAGAAPDRESVFWLNVQEIPQAARGDNVLQLAVRQRVKVFFRPQGLGSDAALQAPEGLRWSLLQADGRPALRVDNPSRYHVTVVDLTFKAGAGAQELASAYMVVPGGSGQWPLKPSAAGSAQLRYGIINDFGGLVEYEVALEAGREGRPQQRPQEP
ncbi:fimbria/pilus periplasmic chaperone [Chromobacterium sp. S0633]|uniref:fimbrial biogenesis chaperone n=1 Tax=Chromobacterium sp. S0633 TaxID=2957805 RepID=UPI00209D6509|nr:fimbria/pilus periplasmic chaperone [Chromobacterium sp. S0633]MCP1291407.1 fimbria/pilus periplasmic chaperone [Chromobacterium sp. S0633]